MENEKIIMTFFGKNGFCAKVKSLSKAGVQTLKGRKLGFETLEERQLLTATAGLVALDSLAEEGSTSSTGTLRIELTTAATEPTTISFYGDGDAIPGDDYTLLNKTTSAPLTPVYDANANAYLFTITIPTAASYLDLELLATSDALQEPTERANFTLVAGASYEVLTNESSATVEIVDRNSWLVGLATSSSIAEEAGVDGVFVVSRAGSLALSSPLTVKIELDGDATPNSDYIVRSVASNGTVPLSVDQTTGRYVGFLNIPANATSATFTLCPNDDSVREPSELHRYGSVNSNVLSREKMKSILKEREKCYNIYKSQYNIELEYFNLNYRRIDF